ncbi:MAG: BamA/TamA family outer membrane protein [Lentimicrobiaceae bacterium]|nr:BamA/TamA family outer membrane protein [Lentimicrobiaceae bacterium]
MQDKACIYLFSILFIFILNTKYSYSQAPLDSSVVINNIIIKGNKITKNKIIFREILFSINDTLSKQKLFGIIEQSRENLMNAAIFNFVTIDTAGTGNSPRQLTVTINVTERWYTWPTPIFHLADRNFNVWWKHRDLSRLNYGIYLVQKNLRGKRETLLIRLLTGYDENYSIYYEKPYITPEQNLGAGFMLGYARNHEVAYMTENDKLSFYKNENSYPKTDLFGFLQSTYRFGIHTTTTFCILYDKYKFSDSLVTKNINYTIDKQKNVQYLSLFFQYKNDHRDYKPYPLTGYYFDVELNKLGLLPDEKLNFFYTKATLRKYWQLHPKWYIASGITLKISDNGFQPYFIKRGLGYVRDFVRGYEYYVIDGESYYLVKSNIKYRLIQPGVFKIPFIKTEKFNKVPYAVYANLFTDWAYVQSRYHKEEQNNKLINKMINGNGLGLDFVTYYDKVFRLEFSVNGMGETGIFVHFISPI